MGAQKGNFRWFQEKVKLVFQNHLQHKLSFGQKKYKRIAKKNTFWGCTPFKGQISSKKILFDAFKVRLSLVIKTPTKTRALREMHPKWG